jgi:hypothetical protein
MSADRWTYCPNCTLKGRQAGIFDTDETLREDWEIGIYEDEEKGTFHFRASYSGNCTVCDFSKREVLKDEEIEI